MESMLQMMSWCSVKNSPATSTVLWCGMCLHFDSNINFFSDLMDFKENRRGSPDYTIYLCFGEKLPDGKPLEKKLITVKVNTLNKTETHWVVLFVFQCYNVSFPFPQVVPLICRELHERAQMEGASSLLNENVSLQISHNSLFDLIHSLGLPSVA